VIATTITYTFPAMVRSSRQPGISFTGCATALVRTSRNRATSCRSRRREAEENRAHIAQIDVPDFGISRRGDFEPLVTERVFFRVQAILDGRYEVTAPRLRSDSAFR